MFEHVPIAQPEYMYCFLCIVSIMKASKCYSHLKRDHKPICLLQATIFIADPL